ncbi:hypothetical protein ACFPN1_01545 [Lysobacter yangpyeongensis]|uniref:DUF2069 domain-containing protein n=1 Tax=Lysobacter yangpyeongensis TaxID=346182 RepID=A0ABW0SID4_9GAMM
MPDASRHPLIRFFAPDPRHEGVRPIQLWGLRLFYLLMLVFVAPTAWQVLLSHEGPWEPLRAMAWTVWATYPALALFGLFRPLRWLPLMFFTIGYKAIWLGFVAYPLWQADTLWGTPTGEVAAAFLAVPLLAAVVPWGYAWRTYFGWSRRNAGAPVTAQAMPG